MASATRLTQAHQRAQTAVGNRTMAALHRIWPTLDITDLDGTFDAWFNLASPIVRAQRVTSARLAGNYLDIYRKLELGNAAKPIVPTLAEVVPAEQLATSLRVTGPVSLKSNVGRGMPLDAAARIADENSSRAGMRLALDGGRVTIAQTTGADTKSKGWVWEVTSDKPCDYCANLDGVLFYLGEEQFQAHDGCDCQAVPAY